MHSSFWGEGRRVRHLSSTMKTVPGLEDHCLPQITLSDPITKARILGQPEQLSPHRTRVPPSDASRQFTSTASLCSVVTLWTGLSQAFSPLVPGITLGRPQLPISSAAVCLVPSLHGAHSDKLNMGLTHYQQAMQDGM